MLSQSARKITVLVIIGLLVIGIIIALAIKSLRPSSTSPSATEIPEIQPIVQPIEPVTYEDDKDGDGLTLQEEAENQTDPAKSDTDEDGLFDGDEVKAYHTDPLKKDSDNDGHDDKTELQNGFDPNGPGRILSN